MSECTLRRVVRALLQDHSLHLSSFSDNVTSISMKARRLLPGCYDALTINSLPASGACFIVVINRITSRASHMVSVQGSLACRSRMKDDAMSPSFLLAVPAMDFSCCTSCRACASIPVGCQAGTHYARMQDRMSSWA